MEIAGLTPGGEYTLILDGTDAISCTLTLSTDQKLVGTFTRLWDNRAALFPFAHLS